MSAERLFPQAKIHRFGEVEVVILNHELGMTVVDSDRIPTVAGGGESLALLGSGAYRLVGQGASIITDTPLLVGRNYGSLNSVSAPLADAAEAMRRLLVKPGLTGLWQVSGRSDLSWDSTVALDRHYVENRGAALDAAVLARTLRAVLGGKGAY